MSDLTNTLIIEEATENPKTASVVNASEENVSEMVNEAESSREAEFSNVPPGNKNKGDSDQDKKCLDGSELEFTRANIEGLGNHVHLVDSDEDSKLDMFCYVKCTEDDNSLIKQCRGVVFHGNDLVMKAFPYTIEYNHTEIDKYTDDLADFDRWSFYVSYEGSLIRMFHFNEKWYVSTHRKLNAFRSKWASRVSFGTSFKAALLAEEENNKEFRSGLPDGENILARFQETLDTDKQYMFLVLNNSENRIVCDAPERPTLFHVGTFVNGELVMTEDIKLPCPKRLSFLDSNDLKLAIQDMSYKEHQGVICFGPDNRQIKVLHQDYQDLFKARGNEPSIKFRYLQVRMNRRYTNMLYHLYPNVAEMFDDYENTLYDIARSIYRAYVQRFIKKRYVTVPREEFAVIRECHSWHLADRSENRISLNQIIKVMNQQSPTHLNRMIRRFKLEQIRQKDRPMQKSRTDHLRSFEQSPDVRNPSEPPISPLLLSQSSQKNVSRPRRRITSILPRKVSDKKE